MTPTVVENESESVLSCIENGTMLMVIATIAGLPLTVLPVRGSIALTVTLVL